MLTAMLGMQGIVVCAADEVPVAEDLLSDGSEWEDDSVEDGSVEDGFVEDEVVEDGAAEEDVSEIIAEAGAGQIIESGRCGVDVTFTLDDSGLLTISGTGMMYDYFVTSRIPWSRDKVKRVVIEQGITNIGAYAFYYCSALTDVTISDSVTSIGELAFCQCVNLSSVSIPDSVTIIDHMAFLNCSSLTSFTIPGSVVRIGEHAFHLCSGLTTLSIPDSVTQIGRNAFSGCSNLESIYFLVTDKEAEISFGPYFLGDLNPTIYCYMSTAPDRYFTNAGSYTIIYLDDVSSVSLDPASALLQPGDTLQLTATTVIGTESYTNRLVSFSSDDENVAVVDADGLVKALSPGSATITASSPNGKTAAAAITVEFPLRQPTLIAAYNGAKGIGIKFRKVEAASEYMIYRKFNGEWSYVCTVSATDSDLQISGNTIMFTDTSVAQNYGKGYIYSVAAKNGDRVTTYDKKGAAIYRLTPPALTKITNPAGGTATITWKGVFGRTETNGCYDLQYAEYKDGKAGEFRSVAALPGFDNLTLSTTVSGLKKGSRYVFRIRCSKTNKDRGTYYSEYSKWLSITITK